MLRFSYLIFLVFLLQTSLSFSSGIRGTVKDDSGNLLPYTTIFVKEAGTGTTTNAEGFYEINLPAGTYNLVFQYIGYETVSRQVQVGDGFLDLDIVLKTQTVVLKNIEVRAGKEDPAYTIMRKAIAKSKYHLQQLDSYTARVYIKGTGKLTDTPFLFRKQLEKEGVEEGRVFISESVSDIEYKRPNTYSEKVISIRSNGDDQNANPNAYIQGSFYEPELAGSVSPLSPRAFSYYRFVYDGTYRDRGFEVSRIKVFPRSKGDNVFEGTLEIVEDYWSIYSLDLKTSRLGIDFDIKQIYAPVEDKAWLPVTHEFEVEGKVFGFGFKGNYLATVSNYVIEINPDLGEEFEVIDEKVEKELAQKLEEQVLDPETQEIQDILTSGKEVTRKQLRKVIKAYEKAELKESKEPEVISNFSYKVDSNAYKSDSVYWADIRPVPLTTEEVVGYAKTDSLAEVDRNLSEGDTLKTSRGNGFSPLHLITGNTYKIADRTHIKLHGLKSLFNTVDGLDLEYRLSFTRTTESKNWLRIGTTARYTFAREAFNGFADVRYDFGSKESRNSFEVKAGRYINQFNDDRPIHPLVNTFTTVLLERNFMKIYEKDFVEFKYSKRLTPKLSANFALEYEDRKQLFNNSTYRLIDRSGEGFTANAPVSIELPDTSFPDHQAVTFLSKFNYRPFQKYRIRNGNKYPIDNSSPIFSLLYKKGLSDVAGSDVDYDLLELGYRHTFNIGIRGIVDLSLTAGQFLNDDQMFFMDYKHFLGNRTPFATTNPVGSFRLLDYYTFSTNNEYFTGSAHYQFRKFLITRMPLVRLFGVRENVFVNYLGTDNSMNYTELGYGINYIFRIFRIEAVTSFIDGEYQDFGVRIGVATNLDNLFN
ncbi:MAG: DUF5686 and carboxypeptidase regulatory-like domain-containing protein [Bacteroidota bacterium]